MVSRKDKGVMQIVIKRYVTISTLCDSFDFVLIS